VKSSSICCAANRALLALAVCGLLAASCAGGGSVAAIADLTNPFLGPDYSEWLVGPVARIAKPEEIKAYLALHDDGEAAAYIEHFWERHDSGGPENSGARGGVGGVGGIGGVGNIGGIHRPALVIFEERVAVADKKYSEAGVLGRRTDRGTILILYGPPAKGGFEVASRPGGSPIEVWEYAANTPAGLDGKVPDRFYRFTRNGDLTVLYVPRPGELLHPSPPP